MCLFQPVLGEIAALLSIPREGGIYNIQHIREQKVVLVVARVSTKCSETTRQRAWLTFYADRRSLQSICRFKPSVECPSAEVDCLMVPVRRQVYFEADLLSCWIYRSYPAEHLAVLAATVMDQSC